VIYAVALIASVAYSLHMATLHPTLYPLPLIGWREDVSLPEFSTTLIIAKIDTGAKTAALHANDIVVKGKRVQFSLEHGGEVQHYSVLHNGVKKIKSSNGHSELRPIINTVVEVGSHSFKIDMTLTDRADMGLPMLLGRGAIKGRFIVNPARSFILSRRKKKTK
jgi:hypothetical protein